MSCTSCGWSALTKQAVRRDLIAQAVMSWRLMTWESVQAGNRASKTRRYLQWWEHKLEQDAVASALQNLHHSVCFSFQSLLPLPRMDGSCLIFVAENKKACEQFKSVSRMAMSLKSYVKLTWGRGDHCNIVCGTQKQTKRKQQ